ncbi:MAG: hypothetical protein R2758_16735 [Bacteroidales bacterium]
MRSRLEAERARQAELALQAEEQARQMSGYHVIVGSFLTPAYADAWLEHIRGFGYDATACGYEWREMAARLCGCLP